MEAKAQEPFVKGWVRDLWQEINYSMLYEKPGHQAHC